MNRREFLMMGSATAVATALPTLAKEKGHEPERLRLGILSDIHIQTPACITTRIVPELTYFRDREVDGVIIAGDLCDWGWKSQLQWLADAKVTGPSVQDETSCRLALFCIEFMLANGVLSPQDWRHSPSSRTTSRARTVS